MRVLQWRRGRLVKVTLAGAVTLLTFVLIIKNMDSASHGANKFHKEAEKEIIRGQPAQKLRQPHHSYPDDLPVFLGKN